MLKKITAIMLTLVTSIIFSSCGKAVEGEDVINDARKKYTALNSAKVEIVNDDTGVVEQTFIFKYDEKDILTYSYTGIYNGKEYAEYNNGLEMFISEDDDVKTYNKGEKEFVLYNRGSPHPNATEGILLFSKKAVETAEVTESEDGGKIIKHVYNTKKLKNAETSEGEVVGFEATFYFDKNGDFQRLQQVSDLEKDKKTKKHSYSVYIKDRDSIDVVENPVKLAE